MAFWIYLNDKKGYPTHTKKDSDLLSYFTHRSDDKLTGKSWIPQPFWPKVPLEPIIKIILPCLGMFAETFLNVIDGQVVWIRYQVMFNFDCGAYGDLNRLFHISLYLSFAVSGVVDLLSLYLKLPHLTSQLFQCFAFYNQSLLFSYHVHGRDIFNVTVHELLNIFVYASALFATLRLLNHRILLINAGLAGSMILQGTTLIQAGTLVNGGYRYNPLSMNNTKFLAAVTTWHVSGVSFFMMLVFVIMRAALRRLAPFKQKAYVPVDTEESRLIPDLEPTSAEVTMEMQELPDENVL